MTIDPRSLTDDELVSTGMRIIEATKESLNTAWQLELLHRLEKKAHPEEVGAACSNLAQMRLFP